MFCFYVDQLKHTKTQQNVNYSTVRIYFFCIHTGFLCALQFLAPTLFLPHHFATEPRAQKFALQEWHYRILWSLEWNKIFGTADMEIPYFWHIWYLLFARTLLVPVIFRCKEVLSAFSKLHIHDSHHSPCKTVCQEPVFTKGKTSSVSLLHAKIMKSPSQYLIFSSALFLREVSQLKSALNSPFSILCMEMLIVELSQFHPSAARQLSLLCS